MHKKLQEFINWIPVIKQMIGTNAVICVWNKECVVEAFFGTNGLNINFDVGYQVTDKNDKLHEAIRTGKPQYNKIPKEAYGVAFEGTITPIFDGNEVVGLVTYVFSTDDKEEIINNAEELTSSITKTEQSINEITNGTKDLATNMSEIQKITDLVKVQVDEANSVVAEIKKNANYSNILALNASIESARAGQAGRGFAVVSDEMRKFSKMSGDAATKINKNLEEIINSLNDVRKSIDHSASIASQQEKAANELNKTFEGVTVTAEKVTEVCRTITHV